VTPSNLFLKFVNALLQIAQSNKVRGPIDAGRARLRA